MCQKRVVKVQMCVEAVAVVQQLVQRLLVKPWNTAHQLKYLNIFLL